MAGTLSHLISVRVEHFPETGSFEFWNYLQLRRPNGCLVLRCHGDAAAAFGSPDREL